MTVYWETSNRPLFVKTVWTDGHRHPVLNKEDPALNPSLKTTKRRRRRKPAPSSPVPSENSEEEELNVSSVRLLLTNQKREDVKVQAPRRDIRRMYTIDVITKDILKTNTTKVLHPHPITTFKIPIRGEHRQVTVRDSSEKKDNSEDYNVLSERVMVWLDLASQNGETLQLNHYPHAKYKESIDICPCPETSQSLPEDTDKSDEECERRLHIKSIGEEPEVLPPRCPHYKEQEYRGNSKFATTYPQDTKRQLHIFIPDLQRRGDCDSNLTTSSL